MTDAAILEVTVNGIEEGTTEGEIVVMIDTNLLEGTTGMFQFVKTESLEKMR